MESPERFIRRSPRPDLKDSRVRTQIMRVDKLPKKGVDFRGSRLQLPQQ